MQLTTTVKVYAVRADKDVKIVHDAGTLRVRAGEWLIGGDEYCLRAISEDELHKDFLIIFDSDGAVGTDQEKQLAKALETGNY